MITVELLEEAKKILAELFLKHRNDEITLAYSQFVDKLINEVGICS